jgi:hypothetical protein
MIPTDVFIRVTDWTKLWDERGIHHQSIFFMSFGRGLQDGHSACGDSLNLVNLSPDSYVLIVSGYIFDDITSLATTCDLGARPDCHSLPSVSRPNAAEQEISIRGNVSGGEEELHASL